MATKKTGISADLLIHPGEAVVDILELRHMTWDELVLATGLPSSYVNGVIAGQQDISAEFAEALERVFDVPKSFWMNLQANYNEEVAEFRRASAAKDTAFSLAAVVKHLFGRVAKPAKHQV
ncbi:MAG: hypothetical protein IJR72_04060 [Oscillospiraceae bacterium]|nr:hypothetical protein [Oscillospiraceae bacterium]